MSEHAPDGRQAVPGSREPEQPRESYDEILARLRTAEEENTRLREEGTDKTGPAQDEEEGPPEPTHDLLLANGELVEHFGAIPTHVAVGDRTFPVLSVTER